MSLTEDKTTKVNQSLGFSCGSVFCSDQNPSEQQQSQKVKKGKTSNSFTFPPSITRLSKGKKSNSFTFSLSVTRRSIERTLGRTAPRTSDSRDCKEPPSSRPKLIYQESMRGTMAGLAGLRTREHGSLISPFSFRHRALNNLKLIRTVSDKTELTADSLGTNSSIRLVEFMSDGLPMNTETEKLVFRKRRKNGDVVIETMGGKLAGSIEYLYGSATGCGFRLLKDANDKVCAIIQKKLANSLLRGRSSVDYRVYGEKPCYFGQRPSSKDDAVFGRYLWAEIKSVGSLGGSKFVMKRSSSVELHVAKPFRSSFLSKAKGYNFFDGRGKECAKMVSLNKKRNKGVVIAPKFDMCLMLAFCAVVDEMVENRLM